MTSPAAKPETPTPRTDAVIETIFKVKARYSAPLADHARTLEKENGTLAEQVAQWRGKHNEVLHENDTLRRALQELRDAIPAALLLEHIVVPINPETGYQMGEVGIQTYPRLQNAAAAARACLAAISQTEG